MKDHEIKSAMLDLLNLLNLQPQVIELLQDATKTEDWNIVKNAIIMLQTA